MKIFYTRDEIVSWRKGRKGTEKIGFVPTMGYLHEGHARLVKEARQENEKVVMSVFVNKTQFGKNEDFDAYPRDLNRDVALAKDAGVDVLFIPSDKEMYPKALTSKIIVTKRVDVLDGLSRPGHFDGVALVLMKFFNLIQPTNAYFGQKDAQQVAIVNGFVQDYFFPVRIRTIATVREADGLAKSSRNANLTPEERKEAPAIYQALLLGKERICEGETNLKEIYKAVKERLGKHLTGKIDYLALYTYPDFKPVENFDQPLILAIAVRYSKTRLIDNEIIMKESVKKDLSTFSS